MQEVMCIQDRVSISSSLTIHTHCGVPRHCTIESTIHAEQMLCFFFIQASCGLTVQCRWGQMSLGSWRVMWSQYECVL
jgi:hypothetical protein